jgi:hypothetical protein
MTHAIPVNEGLAICMKVRSRMIFSQCWGCMKYSREDPEKMCFYDPPENRGCSRINKEFDKGP